MKTSGDTLELTGLLCDFQVLAYKIFSFRVWGNQILAKFSNIFQRLYLIIINMSSETQRLVINGY